MEMICKELGWPSASSDDRKRKTKWQVHMTRLLGAHKDAWPRVRELLRTEAQQTRIRRKEAKRKSVEQGIRDLEAVEHESRIRVQEAEARRLKHSALHAHITSILPPIGGGMVPIHMWTIHGDKERLHSDNDGTWQSRQPCFRRSTAAPVWTWASTVSKSHAIGDTVPEEVYRNDEHYSHMLCYRSWARLLVTPPERSFTVHTVNPHFVVPKPTRYVTHHLALPIAMHVVVHSPDPDEERSNPRDLSGDSIHFLGIRGDSDSILWTMARWPFASSVCESEDASVPPDYSVFITIAWEALSIRRDATLARALLSPLVDICASYCSC